MSQLPPWIASALIAWSVFAPGWLPAARAAAAVEAPYALTEAPKNRRLLLRPGDRLAICGDSITEQRMYSRILETYLTVCTPELGIRVRQYGWSGERADGFFERQQNDVLRFTPTIATTCYGMNDHRYRPYEPWIGELYRIHMDAVVRVFQKAGARVVIGSPGTVGKVPHWVKDAGPTVDALNRNLAELRNLALKVAEERSAGFADVFTPMWEADRAARAKYGTNYAVPGQDGVHPDWAGQLVMAYAFLDGLGLGGDIGTVSVNLRDGTATSSPGHQIRSVRDGTITVRSSKYPFCAAPADPTKDNTIRSGMQWVPFQERFNRLRLVVKDAKASQYTVTWGQQSRTYSGAALRKGVNLAADFEINPFSEAFQKVDEAVAAKQAYETKQIKSEFHGAAGKSNMEATVQRTEAEREPLAAAIRAAFVPVEHTLVITAPSGNRR
ncbi:MAG: SGNH/GDSL hydrolase family protein [Verrucomicrobiales bacterium]|nr:SGNH/GDSL hydrolase family protein [Verrucomicrobiales bacterium]